MGQRQEQELGGTHRRPNRGKVPARALIALLVLSLGRVPPLIIGLAFLTQPFISAMIGWFAYDEALALPDWVGGALVAVALLLAQMRRPEPR